MGSCARRRNRARAGMRRSRHRRNLLPALARDAGTAGCRERRRLLRHPLPLSRRLGPRRRPHAARLADRIEAGGFWVVVVVRSECTAALYKKAVIPAKAGIRYAVASR